MADRLLAAACVAAAVLAIIAAVVLTSATPLVSAGVAIAFAVALDLVRARRRRRHRRRLGKRRLARAQLLQYRADAARRAPEWPWPSRARLAAGDWRAARRPGQRAVRLPRSPGPPGSRVPPRPPGAVRPARGAEGG